MISMEAFFTIFLLILLGTHFVACGKYPSPAFVGFMPNISAQQGEDVTFVCRLENLGRNKIAWVKTGPPPVKLLAWHDKVFRGRHKYRVEMTKDEWHLKIRRVEGRDAGSYMCQVNTNPMISQEAVLKLKVAPRINRKHTTPDIMVQEGHNVTLTCMADGSPKPKIVWRRKDKGTIRVGGPNEFGTSVVPSPNLTIFKVSRSDMTEYVCVARNGISPDESWTVKLHVQFPPTVIPVKETVETTVTKTAILECRAEAWPLPEFHWQRNRQTLVPDNRKFIVRDEANKNNPRYKSRTRLTINDIREDDIGDYECVASNDYGKSYTTISLKNVPNYDSISTNLIDEDGSGDGTDDEDDDSENYTGNNLIPDVAPRDEGFQMTPVPEPGNTIQQHRNPTKGSCATYRPCICRVLALVSALPLFIMLRL